MHGPDDRPVRGEWGPVLTDEQFAAVSAKWAPRVDGVPSRLEGKGRGSPGRTPGHAALEARRRRWLNGRQSAPMVTFHATG